MSDQKFLTRVEAAKFLGVSTRTVDRYVASEKFSVERKHGKVLFILSELENFKNSKNPVIAQVVKNSIPRKSSTEKNTPELLSNISSKSEKEIEKYKILYTEAKIDTEKKEKIIQQMHYQLGTLETNAKNMVPLLEAKNEQKEKEEVIDSLSNENISLESQLKKARYGRTFFFFLSFVFLLALGIMFVVQNGEFISEFANQ